MAASCIGGEMFFKWTPWEASYSPLCLTTWRRPAARCFSFRSSAVPELWDVAVWRSAKRSLIFHNGFGVQPHPAQVFKSFQIAWKLLLPPRLLSLFSRLHGLGEARRFDSCFFAGPQKSRSVIIRERTSPKRPTRCHDYTKQINHSDLSKYTDLKHAKRGNILSDFTMGVGKRWAFYLFFTGNLCFCFRSTCSVRGLANFSKPQCRIQMCCHDDGCVCFGCAINIFIEP